VTGGFYSWMNRGTVDSLKYWTKPVEEMKKQYEALVIYELLDHSIFSSTNPSLAPESSFFVSVIPKLTYLNSTKVLLSTERETPIDLKDAQGLLVEYSFESKDGEVKKSDNNFLYISFYKSKKEAELRKNAIAVRISSRIKKNSQETKDSFGCAVPKQARYAILSVNMDSPGVLISNLTITDTNQKSSFWKKVSFFPTVTGIFNANDILLEKHKIKKENEQKTKSSNNWCRPGGISSRLEIAPRKPRKIRSNRL